MKRIVKDLWTDGERQYKGNPRDGFTPVDQERVDTIVKAIKEHKPELKVVDSGEIEATPVTLEESTVDTEE